MQEDYQTPMIRYQKPIAIEKGKMSAHYSIFVLCIIHHENILRATQKRHSFGIWLSDGLMCRRSVLMNAISVILGISQTTTSRLII